MSDASYCDLIADGERLAGLCQTLRETSWLALDTEFLREKTYFPRLCLIQVATPDITACIDPLALEDLGAFLEVLYDPGITKVMHASRQDLEIFHHLRGRPPSPIFDTQLAAALLGLPDQVGYANLVADRLGVRLAKTHTRSDWTRRPLPADQLRYAADDVIYLARLYPPLRQELERRGRLAWLEEDFAELSDPDLYRSPPEGAWKRLRGAKKLNGARLSVLRALAGWREDLARSSDRPRGWILRDDLLLEIARRLPETPERLAEIRDLPPSVLKRHGARLVELVREARSQPPPPSPPQGRHRGRSVDPALVEGLLAIVQLRSRQESLSPASLASRPDLERLAGGERELSLLHGWRRAIIGEDLLAFIDGKASLRATDHGLELVTASLA